LGLKDGSSSNVICTKFSSLISLPLFIPSTTSTQLYVLMMSSYATSSLCSYATSTYHPCSDLTWYRLLDYSFLFVSKEIIVKGFAYMCSLRSFINKLVISCESLLKYLINKHILPQLTCL